MESPSRSFYGKGMQDMDINALNACIKNMGTKKEVPLPMGYNLLHVAAILNATDQAHTIIDAKKYDINQRDDERGFAPLYIACNENDTAMVHVLLVAGADPGVATKKGTTPLIKAVQKENIYMVDLLLSHGAKIDQKNIINDNTPLHAAIAKANSDIVSLLLSCKASPNLDLEYCFTPLMAAVQLDACCKHESANCLRIVKALLDAGAKSDIAYLEDQDTALHIAVEKQNETTTYLLLKAGANPNAINTAYATPFYVTLQSLKSAVQDIDSAAIERNCSIARLLLLYGAQLSPKQLKGIDLNFILASAIATGTSELVKFSLDAGANANYKNGVGDTPLHFLVKYKGKKSAHAIALLLLGHGADLKLLNTEKRDAFDFLLQSGCKHQ